MTEIKNILMTGGTGFIGQNFIKKFPNYHYIILSRHKRNNEKNCHYIQNINHIDKKIDGIIHLAGKSVQCRWTEKNKQEIITSRINILKDVHHWLDKHQAHHNVQKILVASAVGYYPLHGEYDESSSITLNDNSGFAMQLCHLVEKTAQSLPIPVHILRFGVVLGKGGFLQQILPVFQWGLGGKIGNGKQYFLWIHQDDASNIMHHIITTDYAHQIINMVAPQIITNEQLTQILGKIINKPTFFTIPNVMVQAIFGQMGRELMLNGAKINTNIVDNHFQYQNIEQAIRSFI